MGADFTYSRSSQFITNLLDKLPFLKASAPSNINISAEAAYLIPGHSRAVGKEGNAYIDDFEGSQSAIDIRSWTQWSLASTPKLQPDLFPEGDVEDSLLFNFNRARLNWYTIDPSFFGGGLPDGQVDVDVRSNHLMRLVENKEVFPNRQLPLGTPENLPTFDLTFDPSVPRPLQLPPCRGHRPDSRPESRWHASGAGGALGRHPAGLAHHGLRAVQRGVHPVLGDGSVQRGQREQLWRRPLLQSRIHQRRPAQRWPVGLRKRPALRQPACAGPGVDLGSGGGSVHVQRGQCLRQLDGRLQPAGRGPRWPELPGGAGILRGLVDGAAGRQSEPDAYDAYRADPSADDFRYFRDPVAQANEEDVLERYRFFNGYEGNSNTAQPEGTPLPRRHCPTRRTSTRT